MVQTVVNFPSEQYQIILADAPWKYSLRVNDETHRNRIPYTSLSNEDILNLPIDQISTPDSYLWFWSTKDHMQLALQCVERYGFTMKNIFTWVKVSKSGGLRIGTGHYGRACSEFLILATKPKAKSFTTLGITNQPSVFYAQRGEHSAKPEISYQIIERVASALGENTKKVELFARSHRPGWESWGDQLSPLEIITAS